MKVRLLIVAFVSAPLVAGAGEVRTDTVYVLPKIRVEASRVPALDPSAPAEIRLERESVARFQPRTVMDALIMVPGVDVTKTGPWAARASLRGFSGDRVLVLVDGVRMNPVRGHGAEPALVPLERIEAIEVEPGAGSTQYGSSALGGVLNLVTRRTLFAPRTATTISLGSNFDLPGGGESQDLRLRFQSKQFGLEASAGRGSLDALTATTGDIPNSGFDESNLSLRAAGRIGTTLLDLEHGRSQARNVGLPAFNDAAGASGSYPLRGRDATRFEVKQLGGGRLREVGLLADRQSYDSDFLETTSDSVFLRGSFIGTKAARNEDRIDTISWGIAPRAVLRMPGNMRLSAEFRRDETDGPRDRVETVRDRNGATTSVTSATSATVPPSWRTTWAAGIQSEHAVHGVHLHAGARVDRVHAHADSVASAGFEALDVVDQRTSFEASATAGPGAFAGYVRAATGFRAPNLDERYFDGFVHGGLHLYGNADLVPEQSRSFEVGLRTRRAPLPWLESARVAAYRSDVDDLITFRYVGQLYLVPRFQYVNVQSTRVEGVECSASLRAGNTRLTISGGLPRGIDRETGQPLDEVGPRRASVDIVVPVAGWLPHGMVAARTRWSGAKRGTTGALERESFSTTALEVGATWARIEMRLAVRNVFNAEYQEPLSFIPEPGRTYALALRRDFDFAPFTQE